MSGSLGPWPQAMVTPRRPEKTRSRGFLEEVPRLDLASQACPSAFLCALSQALSVTQGWKQKPSCSLTPGHQEA